ncbi:hypothetical protein [Chitinophaga rhizophila]|uniref:Ig-like domain-containing protein n=1 Tax=Chitinophaga rhizophila TaxID=2866212 RepID=A0ABS7GAH8_9BACT|nr:hypothetical protein [Chitinophaga rhizophila]MBW8683732.1 hypothetical protein [Chitinophaga rhizophila]
MRHRHLLIALFIGISGLLAACGGGGAGGKETVCDLGLKPKISSNAPLGNNDTLRLSVFGIDEPKKYTWEGPNGYVSHEKSPVIVRPDKGPHVYTLSVVTNGGCTYTASSGELTVTGPWDPCDLDSNVLRIQRVSLMSFNKIEGRPNGSNFVVHLSNGELATCDFEFSGNQPPAEGRYPVVTGTGTVPAGRVRVLVDISALSFPYNATGGEVLVTLNGTTTMISFCGVTFTSSNPISSTTGGANIMWTP